MLFGTVLNFFAVSQQQVANGIAASWKMTSGMKAVLLNQKIVQQTLVHLRYYSHQVRSVVLRVVDTEDGKMLASRSMSAINASKTRRCLEVPRRRAAELD